MSYVMIQSWHVVAVTFRGGAVQTRCGRGPLAVVGTLTGPVTDPGEPQRIYATTTDLPVNDKTCNRCLALAANDAELST